ncbi:DUF1653 domain-containing protein [Halodesulfovibrio marinisediminis]|uniref:DUF1653 domain-containing protein n=1 Tax=Halodesulfovibrio marinisediminis DSM 17456 TaxID=1121457 RepID=A0A1N6I437_9BACT|nr:DUF1653 domain-containing protein [Halodesulfovibrio marinisediminis]SIO26800.1 Protein of unknown function [Halodesulfovibrio marinisediminis DSM 17456]
MYYRHFKGKFYQTVAEALDTTTEEVVVIYRTLYASDHVWFTRPAAEFYGEKELADGTHVKRFAPVEKDQLPHEVQEYLKKHPVQGFL